MKFFRSLRSTTLNQKKYRKYAAYIIGEILLIVIGILIALQISNKREAIKQAEVEEKILQEISADLRETLQDIKSDLKSHLKAQNSGNLLREYLQDQEIFEDTIMWHFDKCMNDRQVYPKTSGYESMKARGLDIVRNDSLRISLTNLYQLSLSRLIEIGKSNPIYNIPVLLEPYYKKHFTLGEKAHEKENIEGIDTPVASYKYQIISYADFRTDRLCLIDLQRSFELRLQKINRHTSAISEIEKVLIQIDMALDLKK